MRATLPIGDSFRYNSPSWTDAPVRMMECSAPGTVAQCLHDVLARIDVACGRAGRPRGCVRLVAATKNVPPARIEVAVDAGLSIVGENRVQEAMTKMAALKDRPVRWHFIGQLQRRKVRSIMGRFELIHSVDSVELAEELDRRANQSGAAQDVLLEVNVGGEATKAGFEPDGLLGTMPALAALPHIRIRGLMTVPPLTGDPEHARPYFKRLRRVAQAIAGLNLPTVSMQELSMGMSNDFEVAIEEGATLVRVGTAIFGARHA